MHGGRRNKSVRSKRDVAGCKTLSLGDGEETEHGTILLPFFMPAVRSKLPPEELPVDVIAPCRCNISRSLMRSGWQRRSWGENPPGTCVRRGPTRFRQLV